MSIPGLIAGILLILYALLDAFQTVILPRRATGRFRLTRIFYIVTWMPWSWLVSRVRDTRKRETLFSIYGPLSLVALIVIWAGALVFGFGLIFHALGSPFVDPLGQNANPDSAWHTDFYVSGTTIFTLGLGDVVPHTIVVRSLIVLEAGMGLGFVALVIGYFPVLYGAFSRREVAISLLDARAGSPPTAAELLKRHAFEGGNSALTLLLEEWERWSAELMESHISYPLLCYFRSQHSNQSWLGGLTAVLDTCALLIASVQEHPARQAQLTFAMARHALVDLSQIFSLAPVQERNDRLPAADFQRLQDRLCGYGVPLCRDEKSQARLVQMRQLYEGHAEALSRFLCMPLPPFITDHPHKDNWLSVAKLRAETEAVANGQPPADASAILLHDDDTHVF
ncbi:potassium channel family protein [Paracidobacterium acidisoli]|uniref:Two pore domain potassium channel family protein n=1 Tax=Paracidobacterium acidisoli TaxID=2303751 RepID=A0A372IR76_9BACT|nr:potassium channel family protein [Paracidobacterium acidisoli]MBT9331367.1 potassium channel family protein [Paracidobacterium acidisoli]